jgi:predicted acylesterase/phospholipase RssA
VSDETSKRKKSLVLSGGGSRGAYEVGVVKALLESGVKFDFAFGTSIGAINATFIVQGDIEQLEYLWTHLRPNDIYRFPTVSQLGNIVFGHRWALLDPSPLEQLLQKEIDLPKIKASKTEAGFIVTDLCSLKTKVITSDEILTTEQYIDVLMASSALPILFPPRPLNGEGMWIDGGLVRNTPIQASVNLGMQDIYIVLLHNEAIDACPASLIEFVSRCGDILLDASARNGILLVDQYNRLIEAGTSDTIGLRRLNLRIFQPRKPVGTTFLDFDPQRARELIKQGYEDAMAEMSSDAATIP